jgi:hypothetical protein
MILFSFIHSSPINANPPYILGHILLAEQSGSDISHLSILQLLVSSSIGVDTNKAESRNYSFYIESHAAKSVNHVFVVAAISGVQQ